MESQIYPTELQLNKGNSSDTEGLKLVHYKWHSFNQYYDKQGDSKFEIVNFQFLNRDVPRSPSYGVYISQLIRLQEYVLMLMTSIIETNF